MSRGGRTRFRVTHEVVAPVRKLVYDSPGTNGHQRSTWTTALAVCTIDEADVDLNPKIGFL